MITAPAAASEAMADNFIAQHGEAAALSEIPIAAMAEPDEIGRAVAFALDPAQRSLSGAVLGINGASYLR